MCVWRCWGRGSLDPISSARACTVLPSTCRGGENSLPIRATNNRLLFSVLGCQTVHLLPTNRTSLLQFSATCTVDGSDKTREFEEAAQVLPQGGEGRGPWSVGIVSEAEGGGGGERRGWCGGEGGERGE